MASKAVLTKLGPAKFVVMFVLAVQSGMGVDFEGIHETKGTTPENDKSMLTSHQRDAERSDHSFILSKMNRFYRFPSKLSSGKHTKDVKALQGTTISSSPKFAIPDVGGIVHITRPPSFRERIRRFAENATVRDPKDATVVVEVSTKVNSNSISIPDGGGPVHIDFPDYVKYGIKKKKTPEGGRITVNVTSSKASEDIQPESPLNDTAAVGSSTEDHGSADSVASLGSGNVTRVVSEEAAAVTSERPTTSVYIGNPDYPFFAAIHGKYLGDVSFENVVCSGGIVSAVAVVTSCSCLYNSDWPAPLSVSYHVSVGHQKFANINDTAVYHAPSVKFHPSCEKTDEGLWKGNIAILTIPKPGIKFGRYVQPMNLPRLKMSDASRVLGKMSDQRRHCRVIGWSSRAPLIDTALGRLIPLEECANPVCESHLRCPRRNTVDGFMVEITPNEPSLLPGALLYCSDHVFAVVNTKRQCRKNNVFAACSPEELLFARYDFEMTPEAKKDTFAYASSFSESIEGWETFTYPPTVQQTTPAVQTVPTVQTMQHPAALPNASREEIFAKLVSSGSILFPFYLSREASWIYTYVFVAVYYGYLISNRLFYCLTFWVDFRI